jgi:hypothetical protein
VVAGLDLVMKGALERGERAVQQRAAGVRDGVRDAVPTRVAPGESVGEVPLVTLIANAPDSCSAASVSLSSRRHTSTSGGESDTELTALAVEPSGRPSGPAVVTTVTPVANRPMTARSSAVVGCTPESSMGPG